MANQTVLDKTAEQQNSLKNLLEIGSFFKNPNNREQFYGDYWTFEKIDAALRLWIITFKPELQNASFEEILEALKQLTPEEQTQIAVPTPLLEQMEKNLDQTAKITEEARQKATALKNEFLDKLTQSPIPSEKKTTIAGSLSKNLSESLEKSDLPILSYKLEQTPSGAEENLQLKEQVRQRFSEIWQEAVAKTAEENNLSLKEAAFLGSLSAPILQIVKPIESRTQISQYQKQIDDRFKQTPDQQSTNRYKNEISFYQEKIENIKGQQINSIVRVLSPPSEPEKAKFFSDEFFKLFPNNLARHSSAVPSSGEIEEAALATLWQMVGSQVRLEPEEIAAVSNNLTSADPSEIIAYKKLSPLPRSDINPLQLKDGDKITVFDRIKQQLLSGGININSESDKLLQSLKFRVQAIEAIYKGLKKQDLEVKINQLLKAGQPEQSPEITELRGFVTAYEELLQQAREFGFSEKQIDKWQKQASFPVRLSWSSFGTIIEKTGLSGKIQAPIFSKIKSWFLNTSLGKPIRFALEKSAQKSLQALWTAGREGIKKVAVPIITKALTVLGLGAKAALIGATNVVGLALLVVPKLIGKIKDSIKSIFSSGTRLFSSMFSGIMGTIDVPEDSDSKWLKGIFIGLFAFFLLFGVLDTDVKSGAFLGGMGGDENEPGPFPSEPPGPAPSGPPTYPDIQCDPPTRHLAEEVICRLTQRPYPCNQGILNYNTRDVVRDCIDSQADFPHKDLFKERLYNFICYYEYKGCPYQCLQFTNLITQALGQNFDNGGGSAGFYYNSPPPNYDRVTKLEGGEIVVWPGSPGHIAIYLGSVPNSQTDILVAEANSPRDGQLHVGIRPINRRGSPAHFFRYCPGGNCQ